MRLEFSLDMPSRIERVIRQARESGTRRRLRIAHPQSQLATGQHQVNPDAIGFQRGRTRLIVEFEPDPVDNLAIECHACAGSGFEPHALIFVHLDTAPVCRTASEHDVIAAGAADRVSAHIEHVQSGQAEPAVGLDQTFESTLAPFHVDLLEVHRIHLAVGVIGRRVVRPAAHGEQYQDEQRHPAAFIRGHRHPPVVRYRLRRNNHRSAPR